MPILLSVKAVNSDYSNTLKPWTINLLGQEPKFAFMFLNHCIGNIKNQVLYEAPASKWNTRLPVRP